MPGSEKPARRLLVLWSEVARADIRRIDRETALAILHCLDRFLLTRQGDVKKLRPPESACRLRCGDYRLFFEYDNERTLHVLAVMHRREAYR